MDKRKKISIGQGSDPHSETDNKGIPNHMGTREEQGPYKTCSIKLGLFLGQITKKKPRLH